MDGATRPCHHHGDGLKWFWNCETKSTSPYIASSSPPSSSSFYSPFFFLSFSEAESSIPQGNFQHWIAKGDLQLLILLSLPFKSWDCKDVSPHLATQWYFYIAIQLTNVTLLYTPFRLQNSDRNYCLITGLEFRYYFLERFFKRFETTTKPQLS